MDTTHTSEEGPAPGEAVGDTPQLRHLKATAGYRSEAGNGDQPRPPAAGDAAGVIALDPVSAAIFADHPSAAVISPDSLTNTDARQRYVKSASPISWIPGVDVPGRLAGRVVTVGTDVAPLVSVDTAKSKPRVVDDGEEHVVSALGTIAHQLDPPARGLITGRPGVWGPDADAVRVALDGVDVAVLRRDAFRSDLERAVVLLVAATRGIPSIASETNALHPFVAHSLVELLDSTDVDRLVSDAYYADLVGTTLRREALLHHSDIATMRRLEAAFNGPVAAEPTVAVLVSTIRPHLLPGVVAYLNAQTYREFEVLITVDRKDFTSEDEIKVKEEASFPLHVTRNADEVPVGTIYNEAMSLTTADLCVIWDDDDHYAPDHLQDLVLGLRHSGGSVVGKAAEFFHLEGPEITIQRSPRGRYGNTEFIGGSNLAFRRSEILDIGGFPAVSLGYDQQLVKRVRSLGRPTVRLHGYGYVATRRASGHTWNPGDGYFIRDSVRQWPGLELVSAGFGTPEAVISTRRYA